ncbi:MAG: DUF4271 domain-containing protein [Bacteroidales bacterium]|nr:DUF4271 domain-containing protein [Bacteroidales bacterium]
MNDSFLKPLIRTVPETDWVVVVIIVATALYVINRVLFPRYHARISHAFFNRYEAAKLIGEKNVMITRSGLILNIVPVFCIAMLVFQQMGQFNPKIFFEKPVYQYLLVLVTVFAYFGGRVLLVYLFGVAIDQREITLRFNQVWMLQFENLGTFILIPSLVLPYLFGSFRIAILVILWMMILAWILYTIIRELEILNTYRVSIFYMFLYLCTLEILPLWWAIKSITEGW